MRWTSSGSRVRRRRALSTGMPKVRLGTKWPSITSTCTRSAPPRSQRARAPARSARSAARIEGASRITGPLGEGARAPCRPWRPPARSVVAGHRMAGQGELAEDDAGRHPFVALELDVAEPEAQLLEVGPHLLVVAVDEIGHDVALSRRGHGEQQVHPGGRRHRVPGIRVLLHDRARRLAVGGEGAQDAPEARGRLPERAACAAGRVLPASSGTSTRCGPLESTTVTRCPRFTRVRGSGFWRATRPDRDLFVVASLLLDAAQPEPLVGQHGGRVGARQAARPAARWSRRCARTG